jgi:transcriptional regulator with XRE-family HTH domain
VSRRSETEAQRILQGNLVHLRNTRAREPYRGPVGANRGWSQTAMAKALARSVGRYRDLERNRVAATVDDLLALALTLDVSPLTLLVPSAETVSARVLGREWLGFDPRHAVVPTTRYIAWLLGLTPLPGQDRSFFRRHARRVHEPLADELNNSHREDQPEKFLKSSHPRPRERAVGEEALNELWEDLDEEDFEAAERSLDMLTAMIDIAWRRASGLPDPELRRFGGQIMDSSYLPRERSWPRADD